MLAALKAIGVGNEQWTQALCQILLQAESICNNRDCQSTLPGEYVDGRVEEGRGWWLTALEPMINQEAWGNM